MKRFIDILGGFLGLLILSPVLLVFIFLIWVQDRHSPFYIAERVGKNHKLFKMIKLRSMIINADKSGVDSTSNSDNRITKIGHFVRRFKLDELVQLWNVLKGDMSLVGPRPNVKQEVATYTEQENKLITVRPGITDLASIVFSDEGDILEGSDDPDLLYNQIIRPWKSRLGILYVEKKSFLLDIKIIFLTLLAIIDKRRSLNMLNRIIENLSDDKKLIEVSLRINDLPEMPPPGASEVIQKRGN